MRTNELILYKLKEQDDNYLDELRKNIDARRKARDRENDVEEIVKKQKRLAMLMRDSSGRNAGEIADLQKEIQDAQQDVIDEDIDRVIDSMEEANSKQQENWDNVIDKLQKQLDQDKENGKFIRLAEQKFEDGPEAVMKQFEIFFKTGNTTYSQAEIDKKLKEVLEQKTILDKIDATQIHNVVTLGSVVKANETYFFVSAALPKITIEKQDIFALSPQSPLGSKLMANKAGSEFEINTTKYRIYCNNY